MPKFHQDPTTWPPWAGNIVARNIEDIVLQKNIEALIFIY